MKSFCLNTAELSEMKMTLCDTEYEIKCKTESTVIYNYSCRRKLPWSQTLLILTGLDLMVKMALISLYKTIFNEHSEKPKNILGHLMLDVSINFSSNHHKNTI